MTPASVLVVDDDDDIREVLELALVEQGYVVSQASNGRAALEVVSHEMPSLILLDMKMPVMSGWEFAAELGRIRARGYAIDDQEVVIGVWCVAVPILDRMARPVGSISITGPSRKQVGPDIQPFVSMLSHACGQISRRLGSADTWPPLLDPLPRSSTPSPELPIALPPVRQRT